MSEQWVVREVLFDDEGAPIAHREPKGDAVAWRVFYEVNQQHIIFQQFPDGIAQLKPDRIQPLYIAPPKRQPLSDAEIENLSSGNRHPSSFQKIKEFVRAIEKAHGVGGE